MNKKKHATFWLLRSFSSVFMFWEHIHTIHSGYTCRKLKLSMCGDGACIYLFKFGGYYFCNLKTKGKYSLEWSQNLRL